VCYLTTTLTAVSVIDELTSTERWRNNNDKGKKVPFKEARVPLSRCPQQTPQEVSTTEPRPWWLTVCAKVRATGVAVVIQAPQVHHTVILSRHHNLYWRGPLHSRGFTITLRNTTLVRTPLYECSARRRDLNLTTHNIQKGQIFMLPVEFEPAILSTDIGQHTGNIIICFA